jgi:hypothetical protein
MTVGILVSATDDPDVWEGYITAFQSPIASNPQYHVEPAIISSATPGRHGAQGREQKYDDAAKALADDNTVNVVVTGGTLAAKYVQRHTTAIPLVFASAGDYSTLTGSNFTGCTNGQTNTDISNKRIQIMNDKWNPVSVIVAGNDAVAPVNTAMGNALTQIGTISTIQGQRL